MNGFSNLFGLGHWFSLFYWIFIILLLWSQWLVFLKAGKQGWAAIIPIYGTLVMLQVIQRPWWWIFMFLIPIVNVVFAILIVLQMAKVFGKSGAFGFFLLGILPFIGYPILAFGNAKYIVANETQAPIEPTTPTQ
jgi:hypothetical protein